LGDKFPPSCAAGSTAKIEWPSTEILAELATRARRPALARALIELQAQARGKS
jgi:hypothetical protein